MRCARRARHRKLPAFSSHCRCHRASHTSRSCAERVLRFVLCMVGYVTHGWDTFDDSLRQFSGAKASDGWWQIHTSQQFSCCNSKWMQVEAGTWTIGAPDFKTDASAHNATISTFCKRTLLSSFDESYRNVPCSISAVQQLFAWTMLVLEN
jgi:hypothetical protein